MKRDARIGLAVVLVLGLGVTMLIGHAIYKRGGGKDTEGEFADAGSSDNATGNLMSAIGPRTNGPDLTMNPALPLAELLPVTEHREGSEGVMSDPPPAGHPRDTGTETPSAPKFYSYTTVSSDTTPWIISSKIFGDGKYTQKIVDANNLKVGKLKPGMTLKIPAVAKPKMSLSPYEAKHEGPATAHATAPAPQSGKSYKIENGDTLDKIAKKHYGNNGPKTIQMIVAANHGLNPAKLKVGQEITLPISK